LEHSRVYRFENAGSPEIYLGSADWTARNFFRRVETSWPVEDRSLRDRVESILDRYWRDNAKAREQTVDATYVRVPAEGPHLDAQTFFLEQIRSVSKT
jgi:polyphosphate kinase